MSAFDVAFDLLDVSEGVDSDDPDDRGGRTRYGITRDTLTRAIARGLSLSTADISKITRADSKVIAYEMFWREIHGDSIPPRLAIILFDIAFTSGPEQAIMWLQAAINRAGHFALDVDGILGPATMSALRKTYEVEERLLAERVRENIEDVRRHPEQGKFLDGWLVRAFRLAGAVARFSMSA